MGDEFFIQGTHNRWAADAMDKDETIPGLWKGELTLGASGKEEFQIIADGDDHKVYHPGSAKCTRRSEPVLGPEAADKTLAWVLEGEPYTSVKIEFFLGEKS